MPDNLSDIRFFGSLRFFALTKSFEVMMMATCPQEEVPRVLSPIWTHWFPKTP